MDIFYTYLVVINLAIAFLFIYDKVAAIKSLRRVPERILHIFEFLGGVIIVVILMHLIKHKTRKMSYYWVTYVLLIVWAMGIGCFVY